MSIPAALPRDAFFLLTGGPGAGKTALIEALAARGAATRPETARAVIRLQRALDGPARPDRDTRLFAEHVLACDLLAYERAAAEAQGAPVVFDRGLPDVLGHLRALGLEAPAHMRRAVELRPYARPVFLAPHWPEIYARDAERAQSEAEARRVCEVMREICLELGHEIVELPLASPSARADFVLARMAAHRPAARGAAHDPA